MQWKYQGKVDPRPLWDPAMMGSKALWIHGSSEGLTEALNASNSRSVAVVGNGPISDIQRRDINRADFVVRFNAMNSRYEFLSHEHLKPSTLSCRQCAPSPDPATGSSKCL